jgi:hypothetical protein
MVVPRTLHQAVRMADGSVLIIGGIDMAGNPVRVLEQFTLDGGFVSAAEMLPVNAGVVDFTATTLPGRVLLAGGRTTLGGAPIDTAFLASLSPTDGTPTIVSTDHLAVPRAAHQATLLCDGTALLSGGTDSATPAERYNPTATGRR